jgi:uncharacterized protein
LEQILSTHSRTTFHPPSGDGSRIQSLDVLRGVGVLGMLAVHIQLFAFPSLARWNPTAYGDLHGVNAWVWLATSVLADGKFIAIFAMLLGASMVMPTRRAADGAPAWLIHARRMTALLVIGLAHAYLLWYGDMLVPLALCGALVFAARGLSARALLILGGLSFAAASVLSFTLTWSMAQSDPIGVIIWREQWTPRPEIIQLEIAQYRGGWSEQMAHRVPTAWEIQTWSFVTRLVWQMSGLMLLGMALFKMAVLTAGRSPRFYRTLAAAGFGTGILCDALALRRSAATDWDLLDFSLVSQPLHYVASLATALGFTALVMLLCRHGASLAPIARVGRMALTNYLLQTVLCTTLFYGHGLGLFGRVDRAGLLAIVVGIWALQILTSFVWLRSFALGPVEWITRWFVFRRRPRLRRASVAVDGR